MKEKYFDEYKLKVPSQMEVITHNNLWNFNKILPKLPDRFENIDISNVEEYPIKNDNLISRLLSYLKYLDIVSEERVQIDETGYRINKQFFNLTDKGKELKKTAIIDPGNLYSVWKRVLKDSELYKAITTNSEFLRYNQLSKLSLRKLLADSFSKRVKNKADRVDRAQEYIINFLKETELFIFDGNYLKPIDDLNNENIEEKKEDIESLNKYDTNVKDDFSMENSGIIDKELNIVRDTNFTQIKNVYFNLIIKRDSKAIKVLRGYLTGLEAELDGESIGGKNE